jgi:hypothetical protein
MNTNPTVGLASILGWLTFAGAELTTITTAATGSQADLNGPGKWVAILGVVALGVTNAGRYLQAHAMIGATAQRALNTAGAVLPTLAEELQAQPPAAAVPVAPLPPQAPIAG